MSSRSKIILEMAMRQSVTEDLSENENIESEVDDSDKDRDFDPIHEGETSDSDGYEGSTMRERREKIRKRLFLHATENNFTQLFGRQDTQNNEHKVQHQETTVENTYEVEVELHQEKQNTQDVEKCGENETCHESQPTTNGSEILKLQPKNQKAETRTESQGDDKICALNDHVEESQNRGHQNVTQINSKKRARSNLEKKANQKSKHPFLAANCNCKGKQCFKDFSDAVRKKIHNGFWDMDRQEQRIWLSHHVEEKKAKRKIDGSRRNFSRQYFLPNEISKNVCQKFFLSTLGYTSSTVIDFLLKALKDEHDVRRLVPSGDRRGKHTPANKINLSPVKKHINAFKPKPSHYRRNHAPNRKYLPADLSIKQMHEYYLEEHEKDPISYERYRKTLDEMNIAFYEVDADKCGFCIDKDMNPTEENMVLKQQHLDEVRLARDLYRADAEISSPTTKAFAADLQKVFLLPRMPKLKDSFFVSRLIVFNETFAAMSKTGKHFCLLWHEGIAGRRAEDVACSFLKLLELNRDVHDIILWLDNCTAQNKNNVIFSAFLTYINSPFCLIKSITLKYLVSGHTYLSADGLHGKIEQAARKKGNVEDFDDFAECCRQASKRMTVVNMKFDDFMKIDNKFKAASRKCNQEDNDNIPYMKDLVEVQFKKGCKEWYCKTDRHQTEYKSISNLKKKAELIFPPRAFGPRGVEKEKKDIILKSLVPKMKKNRRQFWIQLKEDELVEDLLNDEM